MLPLLLTAQEPQIRDYRNGYQPPVKENTLGSVPGLWQELHPKIPRTDYLGMGFSDSLTGWSCGVNGAIIRTKDGGKTWESKQSNVTVTLTTISSYNGERVFAAGFAGTLLRSENGGESWEQIPILSSSNFWNIRHVTGQIIWLCGEGGNLYKSVNGGDTWSRITTPLGDVSYWDVYFIDTSYGFIGSIAGKVLKTTDGGMSWSVKQAGVPQNIYTIAAADSFHVTAAGAMQKVAYSSDGGENWIDRPYGSPPYFNKAVFVNDTLGYIVGSGTGRLRTTNKGAEWTFKNTAVNEWNICFPSEEAGYIAGDDMTLTKSTDKGYLWESIMFNENISGVQHVSENHIWAIGNQYISSRLMKSTDKGVTWRMIFAAKQNTALYFLDTLTGFVGTYQFKIYKTTDGGETWVQKQMTGAADSNFQITAIKFYNRSIGWAAASLGYIFKTTDGGETWFLQGTLYGGDPIVIFDSLTVYTLTGYLNKTTDGGISWVRRLLPAFSTSDLYFTDTLNGLLLSFEGLQKTTDGGITWQLVPGISGLGDGHFGWLDKSHGFLVGNQTYETRDGGTSWQLISSQVNERLAAFSSFLPDMGFGVGGFGLIMKYSDTAYVPVELHSFSYRLNENNIVLEWQTAAETNNYGFDIERSNDGDTFHKIGFERGYGTTVQPQYYTFIDTYRQRCYYRLKQIDYDGSYTYSSVIKVNNPQSMTGLYLSQNYPNPFNSETIVTFGVEKTGFAKLEIYTVTGEKADNLFTGTAEQGKVYSIRVTNSNLASGIYYCVLRQENQYKSVKITYLK